ncbi:MAG: hypothetical protein EOO75_21485, partial [Myxococcales bacterium]
MHLGSERWRTPGEPVAPGPQPDGEQRRETCVNARSLPWLPAVDLPHPDQPGQQALGWRLGPGSGQRDIWMAITLVVSAFTMVLTASLRRRPRLRWLMVPIALGPLVAGLILSCHHLDRAATGMAVTWSCVPREGVFQRHAQLARDTLAPALVVSLGALLGLGVVAALTWRPWRWRAVVPAVSVLAGLAWFEGKHWIDGREGELAHRVDGSLAALERRSIRVPVSDHLPAVRLPDVPVLT